jgi:hypothetical protein
LRLQNFFDLEKYPVVNFIDLQKGTRGSVVVFFTEVRFLRIMACHFNNNYQAVDEIPRELCYFTLLI